MAQVLFITPQYLKKNTSINGSVDDNLILPSIRLAQDKFVSPYLGDDLMERLKSDEENKTLSGIYLTLMDNFVRPCVVWWTMFEMIGDLAYKYDNGSIVQRVSDDTQPVDFNVIEGQRQRFKSNADYYCKRLRDYLCHNSSLFPEYSSNTAPERSPIGKMDMLSWGFSHGNTAMSRSAWGKNENIYKPRT
ncbi:MAG: hypothetical protein ACK505_12545 [Flavobacteriales bacterium]|jgi:hypothetical protein